eukprot:1802013-Prymnesium_polylepis.2
MGLDEVAPRACGFTRLCAQPLELLRVAPREDNIRHWDARDAHRGYDGDRHLDRVRRAEGVKQGLDCPTQLDPNSVRNDTSAQRQRLTPARRVVRRLGEQCLARVILPRSLADGHRGEEGGRQERRKPLQRLRDNAVTHHRKMSRVARARAVAGPEALDDIPQGPRLQELHRLPRERAPPFDDSGRRSGRQELLLLLQRRIVRSLCDTLRRALKNRNEMALERSKAQVKDDGKYQLHRCNDKPLLHWREGWGGVETTPRVQLHSASRRQAAKRPRQRVLRLIPRVSHRQCAARHDQGAPVKPEGRAAAARD